MIRRPPNSPLFPSPPLSQSRPADLRPVRALARRAPAGRPWRELAHGAAGTPDDPEPARGDRRADLGGDARDRKSTRLNSSHGYISYAVFCLKKKKEHNIMN